MDKFGKCFVVLFLCLVLSLHAAQAANEVVIHGLVSQGYLKTNTNDYLTLSEDGSSEFNEFIVNLQKQMDDKLRVGLQLISRDMGKEGNNEVKVDWAYGDYRFNDNFGLRLGRVKVPFGLYNQYRDIDMLRTPVLLPTTVYMEDYRTFVTAFTGGSLYGNIPLKKGGIDLELVIGGADIDPDSGVVKDILGALNTRFEAGLTAGLPKLLTDKGVKFAHTGDPERGTSSKMCHSSKFLWNTPVEGLRFGATHTDVSFKMDENMMFQPLIVPMPALTTIAPGFTTRIDSEMRFKVDVGSLEYNINKFTFAGEYMAAHQKQYVTITSSAVAPVTKAEGARTSHGSYMQAVYRHNDRHEWALCRGQIFSDKSNKIWTETHKDTSASFRYNVTSDWSIKLEYHWFDGTGQLQTNMNPDGADRKWNMVAVKTTYNF